MSESLMSDAMNTAYDYTMPIVQAVKDNSPDLYYRKH